MEEQNQPNPTSPNLRQGYGGGTAKLRGARKPFIKKYWWIGTIILVLIIFMLIFSKAIFKSDDSEDKKKGFNQTEKTEDQNAISDAEQEAKKKANPPDFVAIGETKQFTSTQLAAANTALISGIVIEDPENDWVKVAEGTKQPDGRPDNSNPYPLPWTDLKSVNMGADSEYFYIKFQFWGNFPNKSLTYNGDLMDGGSAKINAFSFINDEGKKDSADLINSASLREQGNGQLQPIDHMAMISPTGRDENKETKFAIYSLDGMVAGGSGTNYLLSAYLLSEFNLKLGDTVSFDSAVEFGSVKYHHESIDILLNRSTSKFGDTIEYKLGSNTYKSMPQINEQGHN